MSSMTRPRRRWALAAIAAVTASLLAGCGTDRAETAAAKCSMPVEEEAGFGVLRGELPTMRVDVDDLGEGRYRVQGTVTKVGPGNQVRDAEFVCEVAPDDSDKLRGFAVTRLEVGEVRTRQ